MGTHIKDNYGAEDVILTVSTTGNKHVEWKHVHRQGKITQAPVNSVTSGISKREVYFKSMRDFYAGSRGKESGILLIFPFGSISNK